MADYRPIKVLLDSIDERYKIISGLISELEKKLKKSPEGRIRLKHKNGNTYYMQVEDNSDINGRVIPKEDTKLIDSLIQKSYIQKVIRSAKEEQAVLKRFKAGFPEVPAEDVYLSLPEDRRQHIKPIVLPDDEFVRRWQEEPFIPKAIDEGVPVFMTLKGERVRSKSEQIIADRLNAKNVPYKYECPLVVGNETIHPDFTILRVSDRRVIYYEHLGRMDDKDYVTKNVKRLNNYNLNGFICGVDLFTTLESSAVPFDVRVLDKMIDEIFR